MADIAPFEAVGLTLHPTQTLEVLMNSLMYRNGSGLFDELLRDFTSPGLLIKPLHGDPLPARLPVDVVESDAAYTLSAELPGVSKDHIHVQVEGKQVSLRAEVAQEDVKREGERVLRSERYRGAVARSFSLPVEVDAEAATARYEDGVLTLVLPKRRPAGGQRVLVQ